MPSPRTNKRSADKKKLSNKSSRVARSERSSRGGSTRDGRGTMSHSTLFLPFVVIALILWTIYRFVFNLPVWFDESIGKALCFGLPTLVYISLTGYRGISETVDLRKLKLGLFRGIAFGGIFGFAGALASIISQNKTVLAVPFFYSGNFWFEFALAILTGFWESLFFYAFIMGVIQFAWSHWSFTKQLAVVVAIFLLFHIPAIFVESATFTSMAGYILLVTAFGIVQALLYARNRNLYTLIVVHAIWGMTLLIHTL